MENRLFSYRIHPNQFLLPPILLASSLQSYPRSTPFLFPLKKRAYTYNTPTTQLPTEEMRYAISWTVSRDGLMPSWMKRGAQAL